MIGSSRRPIVRVVGQAAQTNGYTAICGTQGCTWRSGPHVVKAAAEELARWHREQHREQHRSRCQQCGGPITRDPAYDTAAHEGWLHVHREDWVDNVHPAIPTTKAATS